MAERLKNLLTLANLAPGASVSIPHGLMTSVFRPLEPDIIFVPDAGLDVTADEINVTILNEGVAPASGDILVEAWHTFERAFGDVNDEDLPHKPYVVVNTGGQPVRPPFAQTKLTIYARATGDDTTGNGTLAKPFRTFQRAMQEVPLQINPGARVVVDITGIGLEVLPPNYAMPAIDSPFGLDYSYTFPGGMYPFSTTTALEVIAAPQPATGLSGPNVITPGDLFGPGIVVDPDTHLIEIHTNKSYAADELKGKFATDVLGMCGSIWHNTAGPNSVIYLTCASVPDEPTSNLWHPGGFSPFPVIGLPLNIVVPSAEFQTNKDPSDVIRGGFIIGGSGSMGFRGIKIHINPLQFNPTAFNLEIFGSRTIFFEGCDLDGAGMFHGTGCNAYLSCIVRDGTWASSNQNCFIGSCMRNLAALNMGWDTQPLFQGFGFVIENCPAFGVRLAALTPGGRGPMGEISLRYGVIRGAVDDLNYAQIAVPENFPAPFVPFSLNPALKTPGHGILLRGGKAFIDHVKIFGCAADAIHVDAAFGLVELKSVTGGQGGVVFGDLADTPNGGWGVSILDQTAARVSDNDPVPGVVSNVTGASGDLQAGALTSTWAAFHVAKNLFDITAVGGGGATGSGAHIIEKP